MLRVVRHSLAIGGVLAVLWLAAAPAAPVHAAAGLKDRLESTGKAAGYQPDTGETTFAEIIGRIIAGATGLLGVIFVAQMVYAGYLWMTAAGEEEQITKAKAIIRRSIIGLAIVLAAWAITFAVLQRLYAATGTGT